MVFLVVELVAVRTTAELSSEKHVLDANLTERVPKWLRIEVRDVPGPRGRADVGNNLDVVTPEKIDKPLTRDVGVTDRHDDGPLVTSVHFSHR
jgi:hypothetical protein